MDKTPHTQTIHEVPVWHWSLAGFVWYYFKILVFHGGLGYLLFPLLRFVIENFFEHVLNLVFVLVFWITVPPALFLLRSFVKNIFLNPVKMITYENGTLHFSFLFPFREEMHTASGLRSQRLTFHFLRGWQLSLSFVGENPIVIRGFRSKRERKELSQKLESYRF